VEWYLNQIVILHHIKYIIHYRIMSQFAQAKIFGASTNEKVKLVDALMLVTWYHWHVHQAPDKARLWAKETL
jgi:hypothetical protein